MILSERIQFLNSGPVRNRDYVLYWMQASQRAAENPALDYAVEKADELGKGVVVYFGLDETYPEANARHFRFMLEGLRDVQEDLRQKGILLVLRRESPLSGVLVLADRADLIVADRGYLLHQKTWRRKVADRTDCLMVQVEGDVVVPVESAYQKEAYSAGVLRPRIQKLLARFLEPLENRIPKKSSLALELATLDVSDPETLIRDLNVDRLPPGSYAGGSRQALRRLEEFIREGLGFYGARNDPAQDRGSHLSPYLHFGQISPLTIALEVEKADSPFREEFLEQLIVRRELSMNFAHYNPAYASADCLPDWAGQSLAIHESDPRNLYTLEQMESGRTHDPYWNAAQNEMVLTGSMHGYMRMYWGKKILEWTAGAAEGMRRAVYLNNKYELDGRDPNGYAGIAWCFGKHDRAWPERPVFGKVRIMNASGLERKFDIEAYVKRIRNFDPEMNPNMANSNHRSEEIV